MSKFDGPLHNAANNGERERARELLDLGADPNSLNKHGDTALLLATLCGHSDTVRLLVQRGADPFRHGPGRICAMDAAINRGDEATFDVLMASSVHPSPEQLRRASYWAVISAQPDFVRRLLAIGADPRPALDTARVWLGYATKPDYHERMENILAILEQHAQQS